MPFERSAPARQIAIIGGGIAGLSAALALSRRHAVTLYESEAAFGGHARTRMAGPARDIAVDTGFIVFNKATYPGLTALFDQLGVEIAPSSMSFGCSIAGGKVEYALRDIGTLFAQKRNLARPAFWGMLRDILHFNRHAPQAAEASGLTIGELLRELGTGAWFRDYYITPFSGAIWSTPTAGILDFPAEAMLRFFKNHGLLRAAENHTWFTVKGGSVEYLRRVQAVLLAQGVVLKPGQKVQAVRRGPGGAEVQTAAGTALYDEVVLACHADEALALLADARPAEKARLSAFRFQANEAVLHGDTSIMPRRRAVWSSWVYAEPPSPARRRIDLTYWMNSLQPLGPKAPPIFVTLNSERALDPALVYDRTTFHHPLFDREALAAQGALRAGNGADHTWFCGAWLGNGFHEDGFQSGLEVAQAILAADAAQEAA